MKQITLPPGVLNYLDEGAGTPLLLLHGNPGDHRDFDAIRPRLSARFRVIAPDWPGYGQTPVPDDPRNSSAMRIGTLFREFVEALQLPPAILVGNSVGGYASMCLALAAPQRVRALALVSPGGFTPHNFLTRAFCRLKGTEWFTAFTNLRFARLYLHRRNDWVQQILDRAAREQAGPMQVQINAAIWRSFVAPEHDLRIRGREIRLPTWLSFGLFDPLIPANKDCRAASRTLPGAEYHVFRTGHIPFAEAPEEFMDKLQPFLDRVTVDNRGS